MQQWSVEILSHLQGSEFGENAGLEGPGLRNGLPPQNFRGFGYACCYTGYVTVSAT